MTVCFLFTVGKDIFLWSRYNVSKYTESYIGLQNINQVELKPCKSFVLARKGVKI